MRRAKLTARQEEFLQKLIVLYRKDNSPIHYSELAEHLGVNRYSAYDMLRVLEKKGFVSASYALAAGHSGPGRSLVVFAPTNQATQALSIIPERERIGEEWQGARDKVLRMLKKARTANYGEALQSLLAGLSNAQAPLTYCTEMIGALLLNMKRARELAGGLSPFRALAALRTNASAQLETLAGLSVGATLSTDASDPASPTQKLLGYARRYQDHLSHLSEEARTQLVQFLEEALEALD